MSGDRMVDAYRLAVRLYPKRFRDEYGDDLVLLLAAQRRDEPRARVALRTAIDLLLSVPQRHLESHMPATRPPALSLLLGVAGLSALVVAVVVGHPAVVAAGVAAALGLGALALLAAHRERPLSDGRPATSRWWAALFAGVALLATLVAVTVSTGELSGTGWLVAAVAALVAVFLITAGLVLGVVHLASREARMTAP